MPRIGASDAYERCSTPEVCAALAEVEEALGIVSAEAIEDLLSPAPSPTKQPATIPPAGFDVAALQQLLDGKYAPIRNKVKAILSQPHFRYHYGLDKHSYRKKVLEWAKELAGKGLGLLSYPEPYGGKDDLGEFIATFETLAFHDLSLLTKFGVQFGLFGGAILNLGTASHHQKYLRRVGSLELPGCFAMTETGHGSNVRDIETVARYDPGPGEFIIDTPGESARKNFIGNAALHGQLAVVFAQLEIGNDSYGVHAFLVPLRRSNGSVLPGVHIEDNGEKMGLNGVDNGRIWFDNVRIPRENLLNRFADVDAEGNYSSPIASPSQRFFTMLSTLVGGRISIAGAALSTAKSALTIAIRYAYRRQQFGPPGAPETYLIDYPSHQRRLLPLLAKVYAIHFAHKNLVEKYTGDEQSDAREIDVLAAGLKAYSSWNTTRTIQECRESCGGQGYLAENRFAALKADSDVFTTFEGDNTVLMQLVARGCLTEFKHPFDEMQVMGVVRYLAQKAGTTLQELNPIITRITDETHLRDSEFLLNAFRFRENHLLITAARRIKKRIDNGMDSFRAFIECQDHLLSLANAYVERILAEQFVQTTAVITEDDIRMILKKLFQLFALSQIEADRGWFLENGYIESNKAKAIRRQVEKLCRELAPQAIHLVNAFGIPDELLAAPIAIEG